MKLIKSHNKTPASDVVKMGQYVRVDKDNQIVEIADESQYLIPNLREGDKILQYSYEGTWDRLRLQYNVNEDGSHSNFYFDPR